MVTMIRMDYRNGFASRLIAEIGGAAKVAEACGLGTPQAVYMWVTRDEVPAAWLRFLSVAFPDAVNRAKKEKATTGG